MSTTSIRVTWVEITRTTTFSHFMPYIVSVESSSPTEAENAVKRRQVIVGLITPGRAYPVLIGNAFWRFLCVHKSLFPLIIVACWVGAKYIIYIFCMSMTSQFSFGVELVTEGELARHSHYSPDNAAGLFPGWGNKTGDGWTQEAGQHNNGAQWLSSPTGGNLPHNNLPPLYGIYKFMRVK